MYGVTQFGGATDAGTLYAVTLPGRESVVHSFSSSEGYGPTGLFSDGKDLFGTTGFGPPGGAGTLFEMTSSGTYAVLHTFTDTHQDGGVPNGWFAPIGGVWYGTTVLGGPGDGGTIFSVTPQARRFKE